MKFLAALATSLVLAAPALGDEFGMAGSDSTGAPSMVYYGVAAGTTFEEFLGAEDGELALSGVVALRTKDDFWIEAEAVEFGDKATSSATLYKIGVKLAEASDTELFAGGQLLQGPDKNYGAWAGLTKELAPQKSMRLLGQYGLTGSDTGGMSVSLGFFLMQPF